MNIYVGNLDYGVQSEELEALFGEYGEVSSAKIIIDRETNRSKGFGFVEMEDDENAREAINELNGFELKGRAMRVNESRPQERGGRDSRGGGGGGRGGNQRFNRNKW